MGIEEATTTIYVTHDQVEAMAMGDRVTRLGDKRRLSLASTTVRVARSVARVASAQGLHVPSDPTGREGTGNPLRISMTSHPALRFFH
jgi:ABC-type nitrate/sulfonate/bicarbonate transport system ATPase subunit